MQNNVWECRRSQSSVLLVLIWKIRDSMFRDSKKSRKVLKAGKLSGAGVSGSLWETARRPLGPLKLDETCSAGVRQPWAQSAHAPRSHQPSPRPCTVIGLVPFWPTSPGTDGTFPELQHVPAAGVQVSLSPSPQRLTHHSDAGRTPR